MGLSLVQLLTTVFECKSFLFPAEEGEEKIFRFLQVAKKKSGNMTLDFGT